MRVQRGFRQRDRVFLPRRARERDGEAGAGVFHADHRRRQAGIADPRAVGPHRDLPSLGQGEDVVAAHEAGDEGGARPVEQLFRRALLLDPPGPHQHHQVGQRQGLVLAVGDMDEADHAARAGSA